MSIEIVHKLLLVGVPSTTKAALRKFVNHSLPSDDKNINFLCLHQILTSCEDYPIMSSLGKSNPIMSSLGKSNPIMSSSGKSSQQTAVDYIYSWVHNHITNE